MPACNICDRFFVDKNALRMHAESKHEYDCTYCDRTFRTLDGRDQHERTKHNHNCRICDREFRSQESLEQHVEAKHSGYECRYCNQEFASPDARNQHQNAKHTYPSSLFGHSPAAKPAPVEQPSVNVILDALSTREPIPESSDGEKDVSMMQLPKAPVTAPKPVANFACGTCGEPVATILALAAHELQTHGTNSCTCQVCERAGGPCNCGICKRTSTSTVPVNEKSLDNVVSSEPEEIPSSADSLGAIEPKAAEGSLVDSCDALVESQEVTDPPLDIHHGISDDAMDLQDEQSSLGLERVVDGERSHGLTPTHPHLSACYEDNIAVSLREECGITNLQSGVAHLGSVLDLDVLEQHSAINAHTVLDSVVYERTRPTQDVSLDLTNLQDQDCNMRNPTIQPIILDIDMSHEQVDEPLGRDRCVPGLEPDIMSLSESPMDGTLSSASFMPIQVGSPQFIGSPRVCTAELQPPAESGDPFTCNLVPSPTPSEHGSLSPPSITQDDHSHPESRPPLSPLTSEGSADHFLDAEPSSTPSSPLSDHSVVFVSVESIPEYVRENRAYLVATSAPSRPSSGASSYIRLPSVATSIDSFPPQEDQNDLAEVPPADSPPTNGPSPLYCRLCLRDPCDDTTATMCGHIFCNRCIIDAVMARSACPACNAPTLLYCLFRLDI
ncbi:uncharacterized protein EDB91DRAFT_1130725 [Suillus paluster]|uniref:uncharacterized protein n=1 Tax=Suillus paluster TaxID=48578 RepID=UPI001B872E07|nr:uncharacterized protein EDB91DRAFT_1130725 [Suillus paluster]KAG1741490.1 hypothetical protein EDB91DRAFT_1130725 [Suillus paluster]